MEIGGVVCIHTHMHNRSTDTSSHVSPPLRIHCTCTNEYIFLVDRIYVCVLCCAVHNIHIFRLGRMLCESVLRRSYSYYEYANVYAALSFNHIRSSSLVLARS